MKQINYGAIAYIREEAIINWALKHPDIRFSPQTVCNAIYRDVYPNGKTPNEVLGAFTVACMDLQHQGVLKLEKVLQRQKATIPLYSLITAEKAAEESTEEPEDEDQKV